MEFFCEIKRDGGRIDLKALKAKADAFFVKNPALRTRKAAYRALSLKDM